MMKVADKKYLIIGLLLAVMLIAILTTCCFAMKTNTENTDSWIIRSHENTVILLNNGEVVEVFGDITIDNLPEEDKRHLEKGIAFMTKDEAMSAIEDYDG